MTFRILTLLANALLLSTLMCGWASAQDLRIVRTVDPYAKGIAVDSLEMGHPGDLALVLALDRGSDILDAVDPATGTRVGVIDTQLNIDLAVSWQQTESVRAYLAMTASQMTGEPFDTFEGDTFSAGDAAFGIRWRLLDAKAIGLRLGTYTDLTFPTGDADNLTGVGATTLRAGVMMSQRFDDLSFEGMIGYRHQFEPATFADATFRDTVDYRTGMYIPLDWPHWTMFAELAGVLNATSSQLEGPEPAEVYGGFTFGEFTRTSLAFSSGINDEGGASTKRFSVRIAHFFGAEAKAEAAEVEPAEAEVQHQTRPFNSGSAVLVESTPLTPDTRSTQDNRTQHAPTATVTSPADRTMKSTASRLPPSSTAAIVKQREPKQSSTNAVNAPSTTGQKRAQNQQPEAAVAEPTGVHATTKTPHGPNKATKNVVSPRSEKSKMSTKRKSVSTTKVAVSKSDRGSRSTKVGAEAPETSKQISKPKERPHTPKTVVSGPKVDLAQSGETEILWQPKPSLTPMITQREPLSVNYTPGQEGPKSGQLNLMVEELRSKLQTLPGIKEVAVESYAAPGERAYPPRLRTPQRDAYMLANLRSAEMIKALRKVFPAIKFTAEPRIWPAHVVKGGDFWAGIVLSPKTSQTEAPNQIVSVDRDEKSARTLKITLASPIQAQAVEILSDTQEVLVIRLKGFKEPRKWVRLKHPMVKRTLIHPSYETVNASIIRVRLNGQLPEDVRNSVKVRVDKATVRVDVPPFTN